MIIIKNSIIPKILKVDAIVLHPFIFFADKKPKQTLINHELIHVEQIKRDGFLKFYFGYLREYSLHRLQKMNHDQAYRSISYEKEAYEEEKKYQV